MVSRAKYNQALDTIEAYHKQIFEVGHLRSLTKTPIIEWIKMYDCSVRLQGTLKRIEGGSHPNYNPLVRYIEDVTRHHFKHLKNTGLKTWCEFEDLRGY